MPGAFGYRGYSGCRRRASPPVVTCLGPVRTSSLVREADFRRFEPFSIKSPSPERSQRPQCTRLCVPTAVAAAAARCYGVPQAASTAI